MSDAWCIISIGCDISILFVWMRRFLLTLDRTDISCSVYSNFFGQSRIFFANHLFLPTWSLNSSLLFDSPLLQRFTTLLHYFHVKTDVAFVQAWAITYYSMHVPLLHLERWLMLQKKRPQKNPDSWFRCMELSALPKR